MVYTFPYNLHSSHTTTFIGPDVSTIVQTRMWSDTQDKQKNHKIPLDRPD